MLAARFDLAARHSTGGAGAKSHAALRGLRVESHVVLNNVATEQRLASASQVCYTTPTPAMSS